MNRLYKLLVLYLLLIPGLSQAQQSDAKVETGKTLTDKVAGVSCAHPQAARIGADILASGGNAIDAAVAVQWALAVCYPQAGNIGGGGFMVLRLADGSSTTLDFRESAPAAATADMYQDSLGNVIEGKSLDTHQAAGVPGSVRGIFDMHERYGHLPMDKLIRPAIDLARSGYEITANQALLLNQYQSDFAARNADTIPYMQKEKWKEDDKIPQPELAATLERIAKNGADEFYKGETAKKIVEEMKRGGGIITADDLRKYHTEWRTPITTQFADFRVISMPPPSSGGIALAQMLTLWSEFGDSAIKHNSVEYIHLITEIERRVYADRSEYLGDPAFYTVPKQGLLDPTYLSKRMDDFNPDRATPSMEVNPGKPKGSESSETTHLSVVDAAGNAVSITTTLNGHYGCKIMVDGAGFFLNNEMDDFSAKPGTPNMFGLIGGKANAIAAHKRMLSSMTPTIVEKNDKLFLVLGSPGGSTIITSVFQTLMNVAVFKMTLEDAIAAPKFHSQWLPDVIYLEEGRFPKEKIHKLGQMGHTIEYFPSLGRVDAIEVLPDKKLDICGDPRADDTAAGY